jgi:hypothetical protein
VADANPVPDAGHLHTDPAEAERLFSSIVRRRDEMIDTRTRPSPSPSPPPPVPWYRRPAVAFLIAIAAVMVVAVPLILFTGGGSEVTETPPTTAPVPGPTTTLPSTTIPESTAPTTIPDQASIPEAALSLEGWELITPPLDLTGGYDAGAFLRAVATDSGFVAIGGAGDAIWTSADGVDWAQVGHQADPIGIGHGVDINPATNGDRIAAVIHDGVGSQYGIATSTDAENWTFTVLAEALLIEGGDPDPTYPRSIAPYGDDGFIVAGTAIWISTDGEEYRLVHEGILHDFDPKNGARDPYPPRLDFGAIATNGRTAVLAASEAELLVTHDGETFELISRLAGLDAEGQACSGLYVAALAHGPAGFVAVGGCGTHGTVWTSPDGFTWTQIPYDERSFGDPAWITSIAANERGYVVGGRSRPDGELQAATVWTSPDGVSWTRVVLEPTEAESGVLDVAIYHDVVAAVGWHGDAAAVWRAVLAN